MNKSFDDIFGGIFSGYSGDSTNYNKASELDNLYKKYDMAAYFNKLNEIKSQGFKVMRNSKGKHKVERK